MRTVDIAYLAGLFDGEGSVMLLRQQKRAQRRTRPYYLSVVIKNTHRGVIKWVARRLGYGNIVNVARYASMTKPAWDWKAYSREAATFLRTVRPFLKIKRREATIALTFQAHVERYKHRGYRRVGLKKGRPIMPRHIVAYRERLRQRIYLARHG